MSRVNVCEFDSTTGPNPTMLESLGVVRMDLAVARIWRDVLVTADEWDEEPSIPSDPGILGGAWMRCRQTGNLAWMKPKTDGEKQGKYAAREKIASDLAHELAGHVPPALLIRPIDADGARRLSVLSLVCHQRIHVLKDIFQPLLPTGGESPESLSVLREQMDSRFVALDAWLGNIDRHNAGNTLYCYSDNAGSPEFQFIDFSHSMRWTGASSADFRPIHLLPMIKNLLDRKAVHHGAQEISEMDDDLVRDIVKRIPADFMEPAAQDVLLNGLLYRKRRICAEFSAWYPKDEVPQ